jgi:hypothetical protein
MAVYAVGELALLAVVGDDGLNIARLHLEARQSTAKLAKMMEIRTVQDAHWFPAEAADRTAS